MKLEIEIKLLKKQADYYEEAINELSPAQIGYSELTSIIGPILTLNSTTLQSIILLTENKHYRDLIILSRPFFESIINFNIIKYFL